MKTSAERQKTYREKHKDKTLKACREWRRKNPEYWREYLKNPKNLNKQRKRSSVWAKKDRELYPEKHRLSSMKWAKTHFEKRKETQLKWYAKNKDRVYERFNDRYRTDSVFKIKHLLRTRLRIAFKNNQKTGSAIKLLGCTIPEFKVYIENKFQPGMTWNNWTHKGWHIDHDIPLYKFNLMDPKQLVEACHYTNLQPMWAMENYNKNKNIYI